MRFVLRKKIFSIRERFEVRETIDQTIPSYSATGKFVSLVSDITMNNSDGHKVAHLRRKILSWLPAFRVTLADGVEFLIRRTFLPLLTPKFVVQGGAWSGATIEGDFLQLEYSIQLNGARLASVSKKFFSITDTYGVDIPNDTDVPFVLSAIIAINRSAVKSTSNDDD